MGNLPNKYDYRELRQLVNANHDRFSELNFDNSLSMLQKVNFLVDFFKTMLKEYDTFTKYLDDFIDKFDENLYNTLDDVLTDWKDNGKLQIILHEMYDDQIEPLIEEMKKYQGEQKEAWELYFQQMKDILNGIDPNGVLLNEIVSARTPEGEVVGYPTLSDRLNGQIGLNTDFRSFETNDSFMKRTKNEFSERLDNVKWYGAKGDGVTDDTQAIKNAIAASKRLFFPKGEYVINLDAAARETLYTFTSENNIILRGDDATILDKTVYATSQLNTIFSFHECKNIDITIGYQGLPVENPDLNIDSLGATFTYFERWCDTIKVHSHIENARYGVRTGDYLRPEFGHCSMFDLNITGKMIGYPVAAYYADYVDAFVSVDGIHRGLYLAGVSGGNITCRCKNNYGQFTHILLTNCITSWHETDINQRVTKGCSNLRIDVADNGSSKMEPNAMLCQISPSWVSKGTSFENIEVNFYVLSRNQLSDRVGGFSIQSAVKAQRPEYPYNFEPHMVFSNIHVNGHVNRSAQTTATNALGEIFIRTYDVDDTDFSHSPVVDGLFISLNYLKGLQQTRSLYIDCPKGKNIILSNSTLSGINVSMSGEECQIINSAINNLTSYDKINNLYVSKSTIASIDYSKITEIRLEKFSLAPFNKTQTIDKKVLEFQGVKTFTLPNAFTRGDIVMNLMLQFTGFKVAGTYTVGITGNPTYFGTGTINTSSGYNRFSPANLSADAYGKLMTANSDLVITFNLTDSEAYPLQQFNLYIEKLVYTVS